MTRPAGEPRLGSVASWAVLAASFGLSASTWVALARLAGFDPRLVWLMPVAVDGYIVVALVLWMSPVPARVARFARVNTYAAAAVGVAAQSAYHALVVLAETGVVWRCVLAAVVGALPPAVAALSVHMRALIRRETRTPAPVADPDPVPPTEPEPSQASEPVAAPVVPEPTTEPQPGTAEPPRPRGRAGSSAPKRPFVLTQQAAASMEAGGMSVSEIAAALGISDRQARKALRPVPVNADPKEA